ncbi:hypothetical protein BGP_5911 [Beggiatoa sp. PS]|nr:hypothetical protein BGP_5911 [Beggiatoa sp. PS]
MSNDERCRFEFHPIAGSSPSPFDLQPSRLSQQSTKKVLTQNQKSGKQQMNPPPRQMAMVTVCQSEKVQEKTKNSVMPEQLF